MTALRRAVDLMATALLVCVVLVAVAAYLAPAVDGRLLAIRSGSMAPSIDVGALAVVLPQDPATLRQGDVVSVELPAGTVVTHRITGIVEQDDRRMFRLKGDANDADDPVLVLPDHLVGRVVLTLPLLGYLLAMMSIPSGVVALVSIGGTLFAAAWFLDELGDDDEPGDRAAHRRLLDIDVPAHGDGWGMGYDGGST